MKNKLTLLVIGFVLLIAVVGCGSINPFAEKGKTGQTNSNKSLTDKAVDTAVGEETIGIPECDEAFNILTEYANNPDDAFYVKAGKALIVNRLKESIKKSIEEDKSDKVEIVKTCKDAKVQLEKYKAEEDAKKKAK